MTNLTIYEKLEEAVIARLEAIETADIVVEKMPENDAGYKKAFKTARLTVAYAGSGYPDNKGDSASFSDTSETSQHEVMKVMVTVESYRRTGAFGCLQLVPAVRARLQGQRLSVVDGDVTRNFAAIITDKSEFVDFSEQKTWEYMIIFKVPTIAVTKNDPSSDVPISTISNDITIL